MRRRDLLQLGFAAVAGGGAWVPPVRAAVPPPRPTLLGAPDGLAGFDPGAGGWWHWPIARDPAGPAAAAPTAAWAVEATGRLWRRDGADGTSRRIDLAGPVHALAVSDTGDAVFAAHGAWIELLHADGRPRHRWACRDLPGRREGPAEALAWHAGRRCLVASLPAVGELWTVSLDPDAPPVFDGLVHDYRMGEALPTAGYLGVRRAPLAAPPTQLWCDGVQPWVVGLEADGGAGIVHLDVRRRIAGLARPGLRAEAGVVVPDVDGGPRWWVPVDGGVAVVDTRRWVVDEVVRSPMPVDRVGRVRGGVRVAGHDEAGVWWGGVDGGSVVETARLPARPGPVVAVVSVEGGTADVVADGPVAWLVVGGAQARVIGLDAPGRIVRSHPAPPGDWRGLA